MTSHTQDSTTSFPHVLKPVQAKDRDRIEVKLQPAPVLKPLEGAKELQDLGDEWSLPRNDIQNVLKIPESQRVVEQSVLLSSDPDRPIQGERTWHCRYDQGSSGVRSAAPT